MNKTWVGLLLVAGSVLATGCASAKHRSAGMGGLGMPQSAAMRQDRGGAGESASIATDRMLIWKAYLQLEVWSISNTVNEATALAQRTGGYVEGNSDHGASSASLTLRIPAKAFADSVKSLETLGEVTSRSISGEDVTEQYIDVEARLKNKVVLRDRLQQLLDKATDVKDILAIETELNRVQSDIDSMEGRIRALRGQIDYATVVISLNRKPVLGPLGYVFKGLFWGVGKLFVLRD